MNIFQHIHNQSKYQSKLDNLRTILQQIESKYQAKEVYYMEFDEYSSFCIKHLGIEGDCSNFHKMLVDRLERVAFEENIPVVILDTTKDPRTIATNLANSSYSLVVVPVRYRGTPIGTITLIRQKKFDIKDLNELSNIADSLSILINSSTYAFDGNELLKEISRWIVDKVNVSKEELPINSLLNMLNNLGLDLQVAFLFEDGKCYNSLPCQINNWDVLIEVCPAVKKSNAVSCSSCRFAKQKGFLCKRVNISNRLPFAIFSVSDFSGEVYESWNDDIINILSKLATFYYSLKTIDSIYIYQKVFHIMKEFLGTEKFTIDNVIAKFVDIIFEIWNTAAIYAYSVKSKSKFEFIKINPKYQNFSELIYNYSKDIYNLSNFNGTFSFIVRSKNESIVFDVIFVNTAALKKDISKEIGIIKDFFEIISTIIFLFDSYRNDLRMKKEEIKVFYSRLKKLEQEIITYQEKMLDLENRISYSRLKEEMVKYINSISSIEDFEKKISNFANIVDSIISYKINSIVITFYNKIIKKFDKFIFWNVPEYIQDNIRYNFREIEKMNKNQKIVNSLSELRTIYRGDEEFQLISRLHFTNMKSIVNIPLLLGEERIGSVLLFFTSNVELSNDEKSFLSFVSKELSRRFLAIKNIDTLEKVRYIYTLVQEFLNVLYFEESQTTLNKLFEYLYVIISKLGFKKLFIFKEKKESNLSNIIEFRLEYFSPSGGDDSNYPYQINISKELIYSLNRIMIFEKDKNRNPKYEFINYFFSEDNQLIFFIPFYDIRYSRFYEYCSYFAIAVSDNIGYTQFDIQVFSLIQKILSMIYNNMFLYYLNLRDKKVLFEVFEVMDDGIIVMNLEKKVLLINKSAVNILDVAYKPEDITGEQKFTINDLLADKSGELVRRIINCEDLVKKYIDEGIDTISGEANLEYEDKSKIIKYTLSFLQFPVDSIKTMLNKNDSYSYLIVLKDITEQKNLEKEKDDFVATVSHDIKTPLTTMKGYLSALLRYPDKITSEQRDSYLRVINSEIDRINRMLNNLMDLRRLEGNILKINPVKFDIIKVINKVVDIFNISYVNYEFQVNSKVSNILVYADKDKIEQVLHNLLSNAVKYSPSGSKISIVIEVETNEVIVSISDQGIGIPPEEIEKVFDKYYRTQQTQKKKIGGKGLGLYITKKIVELHGGRIWVKSELNKGTTFYFSIPL